MEDAIGSRSRREFLKTTATAGATAYGLSLARSAHAAGNESIKIGMIGCGGRCSVITSLCCIATDAGGCTQNSDCCANCCINGVCNHESACAG